MPGGVAAQGGWEGAVGHVEKMVARAEAEEESPLGVSERISWEVAALLPLQVRAVHVSQTGVCA